MRENSRSFGRTGPAVVHSCGCNALPWENCIHSNAARAERIAPLPQDRPSPALRVALAFHEAYERLAPLNGYETRKETRQFDPNTANGRTMIAVCMELLNSGVIDVGLSL